MYHGKTAVAIRMVIPQKIKYMGQGGGRGEEMMGMI
jgi:hypothetical protein